MQLWDAPALSTGGPGGAATTVAEALSLAPASMVSWGVAVHAQTWSGSVSIASTVSPGWVVLVAPA